VGSAIRDDRLGDFGEKPGFAQFRVENDLIIPVPRKFSPMSRPTLAAVLAALLVASAVLAFAPAQAHAGPAAATTASERTEAVHPAASITYTILNGYDFATTSFYPGEPGWGALYFSVTDPLDSAVNVTIKDPNATRDGVPVPAFHYEATLNSTTHTFNSYQAGIGYSFPAALPYGGGWTVNFSAPNGGTVVQNVTTYVYFTELSTSVGDGSTLPGLPLTVFWSLVSEANGRTVYTHATNVWITGTYRGNGTIQNIFSEGRVALTPASAGQGEWTGTVPSNATPDSVLHFEVYAITNVSGVVAENESSTIDVYVGSLVIHGTGLTQAPPTCTLVNDYYFTIGTQIASCIEAGASYGGTFTPIAGLPVKVGYWNGTAHVSPSGAPTSLSTNALGEAAFTFNATSPPFIQESTYPGTDAVNFSVTLAGASALYKWTLWDNVSWTLYGYSPASGLVQVLLDHTQYYSGETANVTWSISTTNESKTGPVTAQSWEVVGPNAVVYQKGLLTGAGTTGTFTFPITAAMVPNTIYVYVYATNATEGFEGYASAVVDSPTLLLTPSALYYSAGTTTDVTAVLRRRFRRPDPVPTPRILERSRELGRERHGGERRVDPGRHRLADPAQRGRGLRLGDRRRPGHRDQLRGDHPPAGVLHPARGPDRVELLRRKLPAGPDDHALLSGRLGRRRTPARDRLLRPHRDRVSGLSLHRQRRPERNDLVHHPLERGAGDAPPRARGRRSADRRHLLRRMRRRRGAHHQPESLRAQHGDRSRERRHGGLPHPAHPGDRGGDRGRADASAPPGRARPVPRLEPDDLGRPGRAGLRVDASPYVVAAAVPPAGAGTRHGQFPAGTARAAPASVLDGTRRGTPTPSYDP